MRFDRDYELTIGTLGGTVTIKPPIRIAFDADKSIQGGLNQCRVQIYNLEERKRLSLVKDRAQSNKHIPFSLKIGYKGTKESGGGTDLVFKGSVHFGLNRREGADIVTILESLDGGVDFLNSYTSQTVKGSQESVDALLRDMPNTAKGKISTRPVTTRPKVLVGSTVKLIDELVAPDESWYIDNEQLFIIKDDQVISSFIPVVSAETGLISTPERENTLVTFKTLINPGLKIGSRAKLVSKTAPHLDGIYRLETFSYTGDTQGAEWDQLATGRLASTYMVI